MTALQPPQWAATRRWAPTTLPVLGEILPARVQPVTPRPAPPGSGHSHTTSRLRPAQAQSESTGPPPEDLPGQQRALLQEAALNCWACHSKLLQLRRHQERLCLQVRARHLAPVYGPAPAAAQRCPTVQAEVAAAGLAELGVGTPHAGALLPPSGASTSAASGELGSAAAHLHGPCSLQALQALALESKTMAEGLEMAIQHQPALHAFSVLHAFPRRPGS